MSGICAFWDFRGGAPVRDRVSGMLPALRPAGHPSTGVHEAGAVALGCVRLPSLAEDAFDRQPLLARAGAIALVADARIDNRADVARALGIDAAQLARLADSELILRAFLKWDEACCERLLGDYAFIAWDAHTQRLVCARDQTGKRVLFYHASPAFFAVASSPRALLLLPEIPAWLNEEKIAESLVLVETASTTFYRGVQRLLPGHTLLARAGDTRLRRYWTPDPDRRITLRSDDEYVEAFVDIFRESVRSRLRVAGDVGVLLSGGLDSPTVATVAATELRAENRPLHAFHAAPPEGFTGAAHPGWVVDETADVRAIAALHPNLRLFIGRPDGRTLLTGLDNFFDAVGAPLRNPVNRPWFELLFEQAQQRGVRALLTGQRGNATYSYTGIQGLREQLLRGRWHTLRREVRALAAARGQPARTILRYLVLEPVLPRWAIAGYRLLRGESQHVHKLPREQMASAINPAFALEYDVDARIRRAGLDQRSVRSADGRRYRIRLLSGTADGPDLLQAFRARYGIEPRDPTADVRVIDYCLAIPESQYLRNGRERWLVRRAMHGRLPDQQLYRNTRGTQAADWPQQLDAIRGEIGHEVALLRENATAARCLDLDRMQHLVQQWPARLGLEHHYDYGLLLLRGLVMGRFIR